MALVIALVLIGALALTMMVLAYLQRIPSPEDVAVSYETAWDRLDAEALWVLSGRELRDGLDRRAFIAATRAAHDGHHGRSHVARIVIEDSASNAEDAIVRTRVEPVDSAPIRNEIRLRYRNSRWEVVQYSLAKSASST